MLIWFKYYLTRLVGKKILSAATQTKIKIIYYSKVKLILDLYIKQCIVLNDFYSSNVRRANTYLSVF